MACPSVADSTRPEKKSRKLQIYDLEGKFNQSVNPAGKGIFAKELYFSNSWHAVGNKRTESRELSIETCNFHSKEQLEFYLAIKRYKHLRT